MTHDADGFLTRWAQRKAHARSGAAAGPAEPAAQPSPTPPAPVPVPPAAEGVCAIPASATSEVPSAPLAPTLADVAALTRESNYARFVAAGVDDGVKRAAMKKLFSDPHFNVMDRLDTYIDDYGVPDPMPLAMLRQLNQSKMLRLFDTEDDAPADAARQAAPTIGAAPTEAKNPADDDADLQLQPDDAAGQPGPDQGARA